MPAVSAGSELHNRATATVETSYSAELSSRSSVRATALTANFKIIHNGNKGIREMAIRRRRIGRLSSSSPIQFPAFNRNQDPNAPWFR